MTFTPDLPEEMRTTLDEADVWGGFKAFVEFDEKFYPTTLVLDGKNSDDGQHIYYDASYGQASDRKVLGMFSVGTGSEPYREAQADGRLIELILSDLDPIFKTIDGWSMVHLAARAGREAVDQILS